MGRTGLEVSRLGLGLAALGRPAYINLEHGSDVGPDRSVEGMERRAHEVLDEAFDAGVRYFDIARSYGRAEAFVSSWLARRGPAPAAVTIGSKWGYTYVGEWAVDAEVHEVKDHSADTLRRQLDESRALLGPRLALYQIHSATLDSGVLEDRAVLQELVRLRAGGVVVGLTTSGPRQSETLWRALELALDGTHPFTCVQATWNLLEPSAEEALAVAHERGWGVIVKEPVANGRLSPRAAGTRDEAAGEILRSVCAKHGVTVDAVAIAGALHQPWADVVLSGAASGAQLQSNLTAFHVSLSEADLDEMSAQAEPPEEYWSKRSALPWN
ncbi:MAG: aldo/keto reductase [Actinomycetota bacterium]